MNLFLKWDNFPLFFFFFYYYFLLRNAGQYPEWDEDHPVHFVGHSAGAQVARLLQQMLADKVAENTTFNVVLSL